MHLIDLTLGEDPKYLQRGHEGVDKLCGMVEKVKKFTGLPLDKMMMANIQKRVNVENRSMRRKMSLAYFR